MRVAGPPTPPPAVLLSILTICLLLLGGLSPSLAGTGEPQRFKILIEEPGIYRLTYEDLRDAGLQALDADGLALLHRGRLVPIWRRDADGRFGPGDDILFRGEHLAGEHSYYNDYSRFNVYFLIVGGAPGPTLRVVDPPPLGDGPPVATLRGVQHLEDDVLLMRFPGTAAGEEASDSWFWDRLTQIDRKPFRQPLDLGDYADDGSLQLRVALRGWSHPYGPRQPGVPDHVVEFLLNGEPVATTQWEEQEEQIARISSIDPKLVRAEKNVLEIRVPQRVREGETDPLIDVVLLNWIEVEYVSRGRLGGGGQDGFDVAAGRTGVAITKSTEPSRVLGFGEDRVFLPRSAPGGLEHRFLLPAPLPERLYVVSNDRYLAPVALLPDRLSDLRARTHRADYLMIAHPSLLDAVRPLAEFHRRRGLAVELVNVFDIYDEFNDGIVDPRALRTFVAFTRQNWQPPAPRFVLLVGDASWDVKNENPDKRNYADWTYVPGEVKRGRSNKMTPYETSASVDRNLVPSWRYYGAEGHAASDNYFVSVEGEDHLPDLAIGRFPVVEPAEVTAIVDKTLAYMTDPEPGPWRQRILWITNESRSFQRATDQLAETMGNLGFSATKIYPSAADADNARHQQRLLEAFREGNLLVHFLGHGGRYIWRTGPPDFQKNHDLFTLDHLDQLSTTARLPVVMSMTCYSAPFDHPTADSIGEKFLRLAGKGAVAVFAASWRNSPGVELSRRLLTELGRTTTLGEAIQEAKRATERRDLIETYNLLGDPALVLPLPEADLALEWVPGDRGEPVSLRIRRADGEPLRGEILIHWLTENESTESRVVSRPVPSLTIDVPGGTRAAGVHVYSWDRTSVHDAIGALALDAGATGAGVGSP